MEPLGPELLRPVIWQRRDQPRGGLDIGPRRRGRVRLAAGLAAASLGNTWAAAILMQGTVTVVGAVFGRGPGGGGGSACCRRAGLL